MNRTLLEKDHQETIKKFPELKVYNTGLNTIEGCIPIRKKDGDIITQYQVKIVYTNCFPYCFPKVYETQNRIPITAERHVNRDGSLCLAVRPVEILKCRSGIKSVNFIESILIPYLAAQYLYDNGHTSIINGGYGHDFDGLKQYYSELFQSEDINLIISGFNQFLNNIKTKSNEKCFCGNNIKYKMCHKNAIDTLALLGKSYVNGDLLILKNQL